LKTPFKYGCLILGFFLFTSCNSKTKKNSDNIGALTEQKKQRTKPVLVIDAGHGGRDPGGVNDSLKLYEKNVTRNIVDALLKDIDTNKVTVIQTRIGDENPHRHKRIEYANTFEPDLLLTIHTNSESTDTTYNGFEISYNDSLIDKINGLDTVKFFNPYKDKLHSYCSIIQKKVSKVFPKMRIRGIKPRKDDIWMIYAVTYPSILFEFGYITNKKDALIMRDKKEIKRLSEALKNSVYEILGVKA
jgi:N-acetylmuramoyl-L-alanine amidase